MNGRILLLGFSSALRGPLAVSLAKRNYEVAVSGLRGWRRVRREGKSIDTVLLSAAAVASGDLAPFGASFFPDMETEDLPPLIIAGRRKILDDSDFSGYSGRTDYLVLPASEKELIARVRLNLDLRHVENRLRSRPLLADIVREVATKFINLSTEKYDEGLQFALEEIGRYCGVDRSYLFLFLDEGTYMANTHEWCADGIEPQIHNLRKQPVSVFPWWMEKLNRLEKIHIPSVDDLPPEASAEREILGAQNIKSLLAVPMIERGHLVGFIGFDTVRLPKDWEEEEISLLASVAQNIVNLRVKMSYEKELAKSQENFRQLVTSIRSVFFLFSLDLSRLIYVSPAYSTVWERDRDSLMDEPWSWLEAIHDDEKSRVGNSFKKFLDEEISYSTEFRIYVGDDVRWMSFRAFKVAAADGTPYRVAAIAEEISERKIAEGELARIREVDLETSARIQKSILIEEPDLRNKDADISALSIPSQEVDGDFYHSLVVSNGVFDLLLGDVMGKGLPGAFLAAALKSHFLRVTLEMVLRRAGNSVPEPEEIINEVHRRISDSLIRLNSFITLIYARFDLDRRRFDFVDCGHMPVVHFHAVTERCWMVKGPNVPLGFSEKEKYIQCSIPFAEGDILFFYSDGIIDAKNQRNESFGDRRLLSHIEKHSSLSSKKLITAIKKSVLEFSEGLAFSDDFTCFSVKFPTPGKKGPRINRKLFPGRISSLAGVRTFLSKSTAGTDLLPAEDHEKIVLAGSEAAANVIVHGIEKRRGSRFLMETGVAEDWLFIRFTYPGREFLPTEIKPPKTELLEERGYGMFLMHKIMDSVTYASDLRGGMMLTMVKRFDRKVALYRRAGDKRQELYHAVP
jgi:serine phosphatase RsbU (regulator of sigma subunit)/anti-sigma regulatory factor (Ser/Thr protein kinase)